MAASSVLRTHVGRIRSNLGPGFFWDLPASADPLLSTRPPNSLLGRRLESLELGMAGRILGTSHGSCLLWRLDSSHVLWFWNPPHS
jgi:hypothetical protein